METSKEIIVRYAFPLRVASVAVTLAAAAVCLPPAVQSIPREAPALSVLFFLPPAVLAYATWAVFSYRIRIGGEEILAEALPNPFAPAFRCRYDEISRIEKGENSLQLELYRFREAEPCRIPNMNLLDGGPLRIVAEIRRRVPVENYFYRSMPAITLYGRWFDAVDRAALLLGAGTAAVFLLQAGGSQVLWQTDWTLADILLLLSLTLLFLADRILLRILDSDS
jgi:hypothetical protein